MIDRVDEYLDGLLTPEEARRFERALAVDADLRADLESARRFRGMLEGLRRRRGRRRAAYPLAAAAALFLTVFLWPDRTDRPAASAPDGRAYGERLAAIAQERRAGRVPRVGLSGLEVPPPEAFGRVFGAGLDRLGVALDAPVRARVERLVAAHFVAARELPAGVEGEWARTRRALRLYRELRNAAGREAADAYYDLFRPALCDLSTAVRLERRRADGDPYAASFSAACAKLRRRYGDETLAVVLDLLAPDDARDVRRDATQDGAAPDAVLSIREEIYRAAVEAGADRVYVDIG